MEFIVETRNVRKVFYTEGDKVEALKGISVQIKQGDMVAIMGPSGSGKSTFLHILGGIDIPTEGTVILDNTEIFKLNEKQLAKFRNQNIGFVFQYHHLLPEFTALENTIFPALLKKDKNAEKKGRELLKQLSLEHRINHKPSQLSGGEQQRVAIARAIINNPKILIADEPTGNLDSENTKNVLNILKNLNKKFNMTIILATHDNFVASQCHTILYMKDGLIQSGNSDEKVK